MRKAFKYRLYPTKPQTKLMTMQLKEACRLYNAALQERRDAYRQSGLSLNYYTQANQLKDIRADGDLALTNFSCCQDVLRRLDKAFQAFFRRVKAGQKPGYPRFKSSHRFDSIMFPSYGNGCRINNSKVYFQGIGWVKVKLHRLIEGTIKTVSLKRQTDGWHVIFVCEVKEASISVHSNSVIGIDLGIKHFLTTSDGQVIDPPLHYHKVQARLRRAQRHLARCKYGSCRRKDAIQRVAQINLAVANQRRDFHHKTAFNLITHFSLIAHENLNIKSIARSHLAKSTHDVGWGKFLTILQHKAECAGVAVVSVPAYNTTQTCSECGHLVPKTLSDRVHICSYCGYKADRDLNAARNILRLGSSHWSLTWAAAPSVLQEAATF